MSKFLSYEEPYNKSGFYKLLVELENRYLPNGKVLVTGPVVVKMYAYNDSISIEKGTYNIVTNTVRGLNINIENNQQAYSHETYIQFKTGGDISTNLNINKSISRNISTDFTLEPYKTYILKLTFNPDNNGYMMDWYKV